MEIKIQSYSDIITNSSSEIFIVKDCDKSAKELESLLKALRDQYYYSGEKSWYDLSEEERRQYNSSSGMGGTIEVKDWQGRYKEWLDYYIPESKQDKASPEMWSLFHIESLAELKHELQIDIDWSQLYSIDWILKNLFVIYADNGSNYYQKDPNTGRILRKVSQEEWEELPDNERY